jgi:lipopolysaccharide transport system ATP-binding protein
MISDVIIKVENLGKKYRLSHQRQERYTALRDVIAEKARGIFGKLKWGKQILEKQNFESRKQKETSAFESQLSQFSTSALPSTGDKKGPGVSQSLLSQFPISALSSTEDFWALRDVSFEVKRGEVIGIIGRNGAGKSTLLKILSRITEPTTGRISIRGRVASLLEVGTGFHPELTGRENIFLNGAILGMKRTEIRRKFDEIVAFAEVEKFLDTPVKRYSSGMYMRLAFAVAAHLEPEILIVDEVLAVGDAVFQKKCLGKMSEVAKGGRTVLFVSHNMGVISSLTQRSVFLKSGRIYAIGPSRDMVETYLTQTMQMRTDKVAGLDSFRRERNADSPIFVSSIRIRGSDNSTATLPNLILGEKIMLEVELVARKAVHGALVIIAVKTSTGERAAILFSWDQGYTLSLDAGTHILIVQPEGLSLSPGQYYLDVGINQSVEAPAYDVVRDFPLMRIANTGQVTHWLERPWGLLHCQQVRWQTIQRT